MRKVVKDYRFEGLTPDQVMLGIIAFPEEWNSIPLFEVDNPEIHKLLGYKGTKVSFNDFMGDGNYLLYNLVNEAYQKPVAAREDLDKEVMKLDEKINVYYMVETGSILRIYPDPTDTINHKWHSVSELYGTDMNPADSLGLVFSVLANAVRTGDNAQALEVIDFIGKYQQKFSTHELVGFKMKAELLLNKLRIFNRLTALYALLGITLLILQLMRVFKSRKGVDVAFRAGFIVLVVLFAFHVTALALRWYVGNHAPLSNGYESMIYVSGFIILFGLLFSRVSGFAAGLATLLATLSLLVAHMSWMNPDITNLVPVLKSPWLTIHVNVILAGYALLGISMFMGLLNLVFYTALNEKNVGKTGKVIDQLTGVSQLVVTIGLYLLTIGTFLGGVWANESWGRYWGWDPKETWALISVLVYSFVAHMHRFPGLGGNYSYNLGTMSGYFAILMTYFGVNYFLGGIHSYAAGAAFDIPIWVFLAILALITLSVIAYMKNKKFNKMLEN